MNLPKPPPVFVGGGFWVLLSVRLCTVFDDGVEVYYYYNEDNHRHGREHLLSIDAKTEEAVAARLNEVDEGGDGESGEEADEAAEGVLHGECARALLDGGVVKDEVGEAGADTAEGDARKAGVYSVHHHTVLGSGEHIDEVGEHLYAVAKGEHFGKGELVGELAEGERDEGAGDRADRRENGDVAHIEAKLVQLIGAVKRIGNRAADIV